MSSALDPVRQAFHEGAGGVPRDIDPLGPIPQRQAEAASFPLGSTVRALKAEKVAQTRADAPPVALSPYGVGAPREGGRRSHHGVDIFAPRGTEVRATSRARVRRVDEWKLGGRVIWLEDPERDLRLYFAHLETQDVLEGTWVAPGDRIGTVGNTGNARTTPPSRKAP